MATTIAKGATNKLISLLPRAEQKRLAAELEVVSLTSRTVLFEPNVRALRDLRERKLAHIEADTVNIPNIRKLAKYGNFVGGPVSIGCAIL